MFVLNIHEYSLLNKLLNVQPDQQMVITNMTTQPLLYNSQPLPARARPGPRCTAREQLWLEECQRGVDQGLNLLTRKYPDKEHNNHQDSEDPLDEQWPPRSAGLWGIRSANAAPNWGRANKGRNNSHVVLWKFVIYCRMYVVGMTYLQNKWLGWQLDLSWGSIR
jgi:hypothetical protein